MEKLTEICYNNFNLTIKLEYFYKTVIQKERWETVGTTRKKKNEAGGGIPHGTGPDYIKSAYQRFPAVVRRSADGLD